MAKYAEWSLIESLLHQNNEEIRHRFVTKEELIQLGTGGTISGSINTSDLSLEELLDMFPDDVKAKYEENHQDE